MPSAEHPVALLESPGQVVTVLGLVAASRITAFDWLAEDAAQAPAAETRVTFTRLAAAELDHHGDVEQHVAQLGGDLVGAATPYLELLGGIGQRTRSAQWWERVVRTVVAGGMVRDLVELVAGRLAQPARDLAVGALAGTDLTEVVAAEVTRVSAEEPSLSARLALWGRRVAGETLGVVQPVLGVVESAGGADLGELAAPALGTISAGHAHRMGRLGLAS